MTPALRAAYAAEQGEQTYVNVRFFSVLCFGINQAFKVVDYFVFPDMFEIYLAVRLALDVVLALAYFRVTPRNSGRMKRIAVIATGLMLTVVVNGAGTYQNNYYVGFLLLMFGLVILFPVTGLEAFRVNSVLYLTYLIPGVMGSYVGDLIPFMLHNVFLLSGVAVSTVAGRVGERIRVSEFLRRDELRRAYDHLKELSEAKSRFFSNVSHELRTPLTLVLAPLETMRNGDLGELTENQKRYVDSMYENGLRLLRQINHLLDVVKIDADRAALLREPTDIGLFIENLVNAAGPIAVRKRISLRPMLDQDLPRILVDPEKFEKILLNLLSNAIKFTPSGGSVLVSASRHGEVVRIRVADSGIGIAPEFIPHLFERFSQAEGSTQRRFGGTGLGLTLVKEFTELHGGHVEVETTPGEGATFTITLPVETAAESTAAIEGTDTPRTGQAFIDQELSDISLDEEEEQIEARPQDEQGEAEPLILVADDNPDMLRFMADALGVEYRVVTARDGIRALRIATERIPDLVVLDVMMPGINGIELVRRLRENESTSRIPIIMVTARIGLDQKIQGMQKGASDYLYKPFSVAEFKARVAGLLRQRTMERELQSRNRDLETTNRRLEELVVHQEKLSVLGELLAGTAHELSTPIAYLASNARALEGYLRDLGSYVTAAREHARGDADLETLARKIDLDAILEDLGDLALGFIEGGNRSKEIIRNLRTYSRRDEQLIQQTDLRSCVESSLMLLLSQTRGRINVHRDDDPELMPVRCVEGQIKQVIVNLLANAIQAIPNEGDIWIATRHHANGAEGFSRPCVELSVRDSGSGIPAGMMDEIFRPFVTTKAESSGTGLGLPIARDIVHKHGGRIHVVSELGAGTTFSIFLPLGPLSDHLAGDFNRGEGFEPSTP
ncbi:MAG: ATP-binding protein [Deltaproteobacteria bacterium]|nr:ATP-binding protein [Deltaproteobacteria bacterium]